MEKEPTFKTAAMIRVKNECDEVKAFFDNSRDPRISSDMRYKHYMIVAYNYHDVDEFELSKECFSKMSTEYVTDQLIVDMKSAFDSGFQAYEKSLNGLNNTRQMEEFEVFIVILKCIPLFVIYDVQGRDAFISKLNNTKFPINIPRVLKLVEDGQNEFNEEDFFKE